MPRVSFDFDDTLTRGEVSEYAMELMAKGVEVWVVTSRHIGHWYDVVDLCSKIGIPQHRILFTGGEKKYQAIEELGFIWHLDDDYEELELLPGVGVNVNNLEWKLHCVV